VSESDLYPAIIGGLSHGSTRLWRQQAGLMWVGEIVARTATTMTLLHPRAVKIGMPGISDIGGLTSLVITPEMLGQTIAAAVQVEVKAGKRRPTDEQAAFIAMVRSLGGRAGVARSVEEASAIVAAK
jgi:hypothetical protein